MDTMETHGRSNAPDPRIPGLELMDTTLRDGEQTPGVNYTPQEKLVIAEALLAAGVDAIEVASAGTSEGEAEALRLIAAWAAKRKLLDRVEVLGFVDGERSADWIADNGGTVLNLLAKGSEHHCRVQLRKTPPEHLADIARTVRHAHGKGLRVNIYLEDWSRGMQDDPDYVRALVHGLAQLPVKRIMLADTLGVLTPERSETLVARMIQEFPDKSFDFHCHNDYGLAIANSLAAARAGAKRIHATVNGLGERAGNTDLASFAVAAKDLASRGCRVREASLSALSELVAGISGMEPAANAPIVGRISAIQGCGVHADGDRKGGLYQNRLDPARFGRTRGYDLSKTAGMASIEQNCKALGIDVTPEQQRLLLAKVKALGDRKIAVSQADLPLLLRDIVGATQEGIRLERYRFALASEEAPSASITLTLGGEARSAEAQGDGQYDAFMNAVRTLVPNLPQLVDYRVGISRKGTSGALTEVTITWQEDAADGAARGAGTRRFTTRAVDSDQLRAAIAATMRMLNYREARASMMHAR